MTRLKKLLWGLAWFLLFVYLLIGFLPKAGLYYLGEQALAENKVYVTGEKVSDTFLGLSLSGGEIYFEGILVAPVPEIRLTTLLFYNGLTVAPFRFSDQVSDFVPPEFGGLRVVHSVLAPHKVRIEGSGDFGSLNGEVNLLERRVEVLFTPSGAVSKNYPSLLRYFKKTRDGLVYATAF